MKKRNWIILLILIGLIIAGSIIAFLIINMNQKPCGNLELIPGDFKEGDNAYEHKWIGEGQETASLTFQKYNDEPALCINKVTTKTSIIKYEIKLTTYIKITFKSFALDSTVPNQINFAFMRFGQELFSKPIYLFNGESYSFELNNTHVAYAHTGGCLPMIGDVPAGGVDAIQFYLMGFDGRIAFTNLKGFTKC